VSGVERKRPKIDPYWEGEPHPLPQTRKWLEDFLRWGSGLAPSAEGIPDDRNFVDWVKDNPLPDLQELVQRYGGFSKVPVDAWNEFDQQKAGWEACRRWRLGWRG